MTARDASGQAPHRIVLVPGDGIGPEVIGAARQILERLAAEPGGPRLKFAEAEMGLGAYRRLGEALPPETLERIRAADACLLGAVDGAALPTGVANPLRRLRQSLGCFASVRPARSLPGIPAPCGPVDLVIVREVTEGLYSGVEFRPTADLACAVRVITRQGTARVARVALDLARRRRRGLTVVHKLASLRLSDGLFLDAVREAAAAFPDVALEERNVDAVALELVRNPGEFDVILASNAFGDILSDEAAGLTGGLGLAPSAVLGEGKAYFEPVHGSAPDIAGKEIANPVAAIRAAAMLLEHLGEAAAAWAVQTAVSTVLAAEQVRTPDLGGTASTRDVTEAIAEAIPQPRYAGAGG